MMKTILAAIFTVLAIAIAMIAGCYATALRPQAQTISEPISVDAFRLATGNNQLPTTASNIWYAHSSVGLGGRAFLYRFDAPEIDCQAYAQLINTSSPDQAGNSTTSILTPLNASPEPIDHDFLKRAYGLNTTGWFDVENIHAGWKGRGPPSSLASIWIDSEQGRFYYYWTD